MVPLSFCPNDKNKQWHFPDIWAMHLAMTKRIIFHIGGSKCGSSAVQDYLRNNHRVMMDENKVLTPGQKMDMESPLRSEQIFYFQEVKLKENRREILTEDFSALAEFMDEKDLTLLIVSAENLSLIPDLPPDLAAAATAAGFDQAQVSCYIRRQDDFAISAWQQWGLKTHDDMAGYVEEISSSFADWNRLLLPWEDAFGLENTKVRPFRRDMLKDGDVVADFLDVMNVPHEGCAPLKGLANRSFSEHLGDLAHRARDVFDGPHDNRFYDLMIPAIGEAVFKDRSGSYLMTLQERLDFLDRFAEGNEALKARHLPELGAQPLFNPPTEKDVVALSETDKLRAENALLIRAVFRLSDRIEKLEEHQRQTARQQSRLPSVPPKAEPEKPAARKSGLWPFKGRA